ncbi:hypothetical protein B0H13DRAFT_1916018 [Mycena leptocephala]|nr:hypothetical protein B0H13DRAFT_1916018 [Mycena leptocephala]
MDESSDSSDAELIHDMPELHNNSDPGSDDDEEIDIHEENDIPHPKDHADLVHWLKLSDEHLASLHTSSAPLQRGSYHSTKIGKNLSVRRTQELRKAEKERAEREKRGQETWSENKQLTPLLLPCTANRSGAQA